MVLLGTETTLKPRVLDVLGSNLDTARLSTSGGVILGSYHSGERES